jgi:predicted AlkP superfamily pyrophosphatase or phosphodiesterase
MLPRIVWAAATCLAIMTATGCVDPAGSGTARAGDDAIDHVVAISVDGLNPSAIRRLGRAGTPSFHRLIREGAATLNARSIHEVTRTLPNHTSMVTGRRATDEDGHGVTFNDDNGETVHEAAGERVASMFTVVHDRGGQTAFYSAKHKFAFLDRSWDRRHGRADPVGRNDGRDKIDRYVYGEDADVVAMLCDQLRDDPAELGFLHVALPDDAGHADGFMGRQYLDAVRRADTLVGHVLTTVSGNRYLRAHTAVVLTADHGGRGDGHRAPARRANYRVPFMVWGASVAPGARLYRINPARRDPGDRRTTYSGRQPIRNGELANLVTDLLDLPAVPGSRFNSRQRLQVAR